MTVYTQTYVYISIMFSTHNYMYIGLKRLSNFTNNYRYTRLN